MSSILWHLLSVLKTISNRGVSELLCVGVRLCHPIWESLGHTAIGKHYDDDPAQPFMD